MERAVRHEEKSSLNPKAIFAEIARTLCGFFSLVEPRLLNPWQLIRAKEGLASREARFLRDYSAACEYTAPSKKGVSTETKENPLDPSLTKLHPQAQSARGSGCKPICIPGFVLLQEFLQSNQIAKQLICISRFTFKPHPQRAVIK